MLVLFVVVARKIFGRVEGGGGGGLKEGMLLELPSGRR